MTKAYLIGQITVTNPQAYAVYSAQVPHTIAAFGGKYLVRGGHATQLEGQAQGERNVVVEFPSREIAEAWYNSEEYRPLRELRMKAAPGRAILFEGRDLIG